MAEAKIKTERDLKEAEARADRERVAADAGDARSGGDGGRGGRNSWRQDDSHLESKGSAGC